MPLAVRMNPIWFEGRVRWDEPLQGRLGRVVLMVFFVLCILSFLVLPPLSSFTRRNNEVVSFRLITRENLFTWSYQWSVRLSIALPVIQERKSITGESDQYQQPLYLQNDLRKNHVQMRESCSVAPVVPIFIYLWHVLNLDETVHDAALQEEGVIILKLFESQGWCQALWEIGIPKSNCCKLLRRVGAARIRGCVEDLTAHNCESDGFKQTASLMPRWHWTNNYVVYTWNTE